MLARLFVLIGGMIVLALTVALIGPYFIDWTSYRADFEREASRVLGRQVTVSGTASARLLPFPSVTFSDVRVAGDNPGAAPVLTAETFSMDAELAPFMRGEIHIFDLRLVNPRAVVAVSENGVVNWSVRPEGPFRPTQVTLENISIVNGHITIRHAAGQRDHVVNRLNASVSAKTLAGPWRFGGDMEFDGVDLHLAASTGTVSSDGNMRLRVHAKPAEVGFSVDTDGNVRLVQGAAVYSGQFRLEADKKQQLLKAADNVFNVTVEGETQSDTSSYRLQGKFTVDHRLVDVSEFLFESGPENDPYTAEGSAFLDFGLEPRFSIKAEGQQVRFEDTTQDSAESMPLDERISSVAEAIQKLPRPRIPGHVEFDLPAIVAGDTTIREVKLSAEPEADGWRIGAFTAQLPGRATLEANGFLSIGNQFGFHGSLLLAVGQPSGFAAWLSKDVDESIRRLPSAGFSALADITEERQTFRELELMLGEARFTGEIDHNMPEEAKPSMLLRLKGGELDFDGLTAFASIFVDDRGGARFADHNLDFAIEAGPVVTQGITAGMVDTALRLKDGRLDIDRLSIRDLAGSTISATAKVHGFPESPTGNIDASIVSVDLAPLVKMLSERFPDQELIAGLAKRLVWNPELLTDANIDLFASAAANQDGTIGIALSAHGTGGGTDFTTTGSATTRGNRIEGPVSFSASVKNDDAARIFALAGLPSIELGLTGPTEAMVKINGGNDQVYELAAELRGLGSSASFNGRLSSLENSLNLDGETEIQSRDLEPWLVSAGMPLPVFGEGLPAEFAADLRLTDGVLELSNAAGKISSGKFGADLSIDTRANLPAVSGKLSFSSVDPKPALVMLFGSEAFSQGEATGIPFNPEASYPFTADIDVYSERVVNGNDLILEDAEFHAVLGRDRIRITDLKARFGEGRITGLFELQNSAGTGLFSTQLKIDQAKFEFGDRDFGIAALTDLTATLTASGKTVSALISALSGSGTLKLQAPEVLGINPDVFANIIGRADKLGKDIDKSDFGKEIAELAGSGNLAASDAEFAFTIAAGVMRTPPIELTHPLARLQIELRTDIATGSIEGSGAISYEPGREALVGAEPVIELVLTGNIESTNLQFNTEPMERFLTQRTLEIEQFRVESIQAGLLERQRLRREVQYFAGLADARKASAEAEKRRQGTELPELPDNSVLPSDGDAVIRLPLPDLGTAPAMPEETSQIAVGEVNPDDNDDRNSAAFKQFQNDQLTIDTFLKSLEKHP